MIVMGVNEQEPGKRSDHNMSMCSFVSVQYRVH